MDELLGRVFQIVTAKHKTSVPWKVDEPYEQPFHAFVDDTWRPMRTSTNNESDRSIQKLALYSWNVDFIIPFPDARMRAVVSHLQSLIEADPEKPSTGSIIFLQECVESDLQLIASDPWVRSNFTLSDLDTSFWQSGHYGTLSLIDRRLAIRTSFRVHYSATRMERDALFSDVVLPGSRTLRVCNTHLESLALEPAYRPPQLQLAAKWMHADAVDGAILAGDLNAIQDFDRRLHIDNNLRDLYLELGGTEDDPAGHTWGQQAATEQRTRFGTSRMDKVMFCGKALTPEAFTIGGRDVVLDGAAERDEFARLGFEKAWVTDHLLVKAVFGFGAGRQGGNRSSSM